MSEKFLYTVVLMMCFVLRADADNLGYSKEHQLLFGIDVDYAPMEYVDDKGEAQGLDIEFTQILMKRLDIPYTYAPNTWENIADDVLKGRVDLGMMVYSSYRRDSTNYSRAVFRLYYQMITRKDAPKMYGLRDVEGKKIAFMSSRPIIDTLTQAGADIQVVKDLKRATYELSRGKYDAVICFRYQARHLISVNHLENLLQTEDLALMPREYCYVSHDKHLIDAINVELDKMEEEGIIDDVYGDVRSKFGGLEIPMWIRWLFVALIIGYLLFFIVVQNRHQKKLRKEMKRARQSERMKTVFLGNVSHALRTPLNAIIGFSDVLIAEEGTMGEEVQRKVLGLINKNGHQLLYFINELLELSDIEGNELNYDRKEVDLAVAMKELADQTRPLLKPGVEMRVEGNGGTAVIDQKLMRMVTMHALDNAAKNTEKGHVTLKYYPKDGGLRIDVIDTGKGLPEELKENLFGMLHEKSAYMQNNVPGLGLSICKAIVERSHGHIGADSPPEGGTILWYWIPVKVTENMD